ncbi:MAG: YkgJ family cysteine cluster protein [Candidatus Methylumidiphilus sp.]
MNCRPGCGACCIALSISTPIPGMPNGKPSGVRCVQLTDDLRCAIFTDPRRPACCAGLKPSVEMCGDSQAEALAYLRWLERATKPGFEFGKTYAAHASNVPAVSFVGHCFTWATEGGM